MRRYANTTTAKHMPSIQSQLAERRPKRFENSSTEYCISTPYFEKRKTKRRVETKYNSVAARGQPIRGESFEINKSTYDMRQQRAWVCFVSFSDVNVNTGWNRWPHRCGAFSMPCLAACEIFEAIKNSRDTYQHHDTPAHTDRAGPLHAHVA